MSLTLKILDIPLNEWFLPGSCAKLYNARDYSYKFVLRREQTYSTLVESGKETITRFVYAIR